MQNVLEAHMTSCLCLSVLVGCPASPTQLPQGPCLIIDAESIDKKELIARNLLYKLSRTVGQRYCTRRSDGDIRI